MQGLASQNGILAPLFLSAVQLLALVPLLLAIYRTYQLPNSFQAEYLVYQGVESALARIMMPHKVGAFPVLSVDAQYVGHSQAVGQIPVCGSDLGSALGANGRQSRQLPEWMLPDDEAGLSQLTATFVCPQPSCAC